MKLPELVKHLASDDDAEMYPNTLSMMSQILFGRQDHYLPVDLPQTVIESATT